MGCRDLIIPKIRCYFYVNAPIDFFILLKSSSIYTGFVGGKVELFIFYKSNVAIENNPKRKRLYKVLTGFVYMITSIISLILAGFFDEKIFFYTGVAFLMAFGYWLAAINSNLRDIYTYGLITGFFLMIAYEIRLEHKLGAIILAIVMILGAISNVLDSIYNLVHGVDPDLIETKEGISAFKVAKFAFKIWRLGK